MSDTDHDLDPRVHPIQGAARAEARGSLVSARSNCDTSDSEFPKDKATVKRRATDPSAPSCFDFYLGVSAFQSG
jgi:hypothetical protein